MSQGGFYHYGARFYDASLMRWTMPDPALQPAAPGQANRFGCVGGDPVNAVDPSGRSIGGTATANTPYCVVHHTHCGSGNIDRGRIGMTVLDVAYTGLSSASVASACFFSGGAACAGAAVGGGTLDWYVYSQGYFKGSYLRDGNGQ